jgi:hypothetical protein
MRAPPWLSCAVVLLLAAGCEQLGRELGGGRDGNDAGATPDADDAGIVGAGCGIEQQSGAQLCLATSMCPDVIVDTQAMPRCGFRIHGGTVDLVCACGTALCPMGVFTTCAQAAKLLANQTEQGVCVQLAEGRCVELGTRPSPSPSSSSGANPSCDRQCLADCGGGAACASVCNCD